jgi:hypothetical protein
MTPMRPDSRSADGSVALAASTGAAQADSPALLPELPRLALRGRARTRAGELELGATAGRWAIGALLLGAFVLVVFATGRASVLVPRSTSGFPHWMSGPLHFLFGHPTAHYTALNLSYSGLVMLMMLAYFAALLAWRTLSLRVVWVTILALHLLLLLSAPMQLTDLFNYLGYARLGAVHHLNPYVHTIDAESFDPVFRFTTWDHLRSPYGPLFTAISYPIALLPLPVAYWALKLLAVLASLTLIALLARTARLLGRDPRFVLVFVALNPIYVFYAVGAFHNDFFMLIPSMAAIPLLVTRRDRSAGAMVMLAVAVKFTAVLLLPFLLIAAVPSERRLKVLQGAALALAPLLALSLLLFGFTLPNLQDQSTLLTPFSVPNLVGVLLGIGGGTPTLLRLADLALVPTVIYFLRRRRGDWIAGAGWSTLALICTLAWLMPWYIIWVLPLAALGTSARLRRAALAFTVFLVLSFIPATQMLMSATGINPLHTAAGAASTTLQGTLAK